jgi:hypothetical protein
MSNIVQKLAAKKNMSVDEFVGEMRKRGCSEPTAIKIWNGNYEEFVEFKDNDVCLSNLRKAADVLQVTTRVLLPECDHHKSVRDVILTRSNLNV